MMRRFSNRNLEGSYRSLFPWEHHQFGDHLLRLSLDDRRKRFLGIVSNEFVRRHAREILTNRRSKVIGWFDDGRLRGAVEIVWEINGIAEAAFSVEACNQRHGIGSQLAERALRAAGNRGVRTLYTSMLGSNIGMRRLLKRCGADIVLEGPEVEGVCPTGQRSTVSILLEIVDEQSGLLTATNPYRLSNLFRSPE